MNAQFYILVILLAAIFMFGLYFMIKNIVTKTIKKEIKKIKAPLEVLANYLIQESQNNTNAENNTNEVKANDEPVNISEEFVDLKNSNRTNAYNMRVQKLWEAYQSKKITLEQYNEALKELKKTFGVLDELQP